MKKYGKILSVLLCVAMLVGMIAMVATAQEAETLSTRDPSEAVTGILPVSQHWLLQG